MFLFCIFSHALLYLHKFQRNNKCKSKRNKRPFMNIKFNFLPFQKMTSSVTQICGQWKLLNDWCNFSTFISKPKKFSLTIFLLSSSSLLSLSASMIFSLLSFIWFCLAISRFLASSKALLRSNSCCSRNLWAAKA